MQAAKGRSAAGFCTCQVHQVQPGSADVGGAVAVHRLALQLASEHTAGEQGRTREWRAHHTKEAQNEPFVTQGGTRPDDHGPVHRQALQQAACRAHLCDRLDRSFMLVSPTRRFAWPMRSSATTSSTAEGGQLKQVANQ